MKNEMNIVNAEFDELKSSINYLNNHFKYKDLIDINRDKSNTESKALVVIKNNALLNFNNKTKKFAKFSLKSVLISLAISFINLFI